MVASFRRHGSEGVTANGWVNGCVRSAVALCILAGLLLPTLPSQAAATSGWGLAIEIDTDNPGNASGSQVAVDGSGNAVAVWVQSDGAQYNIWANRYVVGSGWGTATLIETDDAGIAGGPQVAADGSRNAFAVWQQSNGTRVNIWANRYVAGSGWGTATLIETDNGGDASNPQVSVDGSGNAFAVWQQSSGARDNIWANRFVVGSGWGTATLIETDNAGRARFPQVAADASGNAVAVWEQFDGALDNIWANRFVVGSGWGTATLIETADASYATNPQVAVDGSGNAVAVWNQFDGTPYNIWANRFVVGSGWGIATLIETDDTGDAGGYQVAADASGNVVAVWTQFDGTRFNILASRYVVGLGWGTATFIETDNAGDASGSQIAVDASGNVVALWHQSDGIGYNIWANRYVVGSGWGTATLIETGDAGQAFFPQVAVDASGNAFAVWFQSDGIQYNIWANQFVPPDVTPPALLLVEPLGGTVTNRSAILVSGWTEPDASVSVRGIQAAVNSTGYFSVLVALAPGVNSIPVSARDAFGNSASASVNVMFEDPVPPLEDQFAAAQANASATAASLAASQLQLVAAQANLTAAQARVSTLEASAAATQAALAAAQARESALEANATAAKADLASAQSRITALETNGSADQTGAASGQAGLAVLLAVVGIAVGAVGCALALRSRRLAAVVVEPASPPASPPKQP